MLAARCAATILAASFPLTCSTAEAESVLSVLSKAGVMGTWAASCRAGASEANWFVTYYASDNGAVRRRSLLGKNKPPLDGAIDSAQIKGLNLVFMHLRNDDPNWGQGNGRTFDTLLDMTGGRQRTISSVTGDGMVLIKDSKIVSSGKPSVVMERCTQ